MTLYGAIPFTSNTGVDRCSSGMDDGVKPGTVYWQAARLCEGCAAGYETSAVRRFIVRVDLDLGLTVPERAYRGYPVIASVRAGGVPDGGRVTVQRRAGKKWKAVVSTKVRNEPGRVVFTLPQGRVRLRLKATGGTSHVRAVKVVAPRGWTTTHDVGSYHDQDGASTRAPSTGTAR